MYNKLLGVIREERGPFTEELVEGWHKKDLDDVGKYYETCLRSIFSSLVEKGLYFEGIEEVCPKEFYDAITKPNGSGLKDFEISKNSFFGIRLKLFYVEPGDSIKNKIPLKHPLQFLPYTNKHGDIYVRNSLYSLQFVLSERGPSVDGTNNKTIFVRVLGYRFKVTVELHRYYKLHTNKATGDVTKHPLAVKFPATRFFNSRKDRKILDKNVPIPLLSWYIFGKYGFDHAMKHYAECDYRIGYQDDLVKNCPESEGWEIFLNGDGIHPKAMGEVNLANKEPGIAIKQRNKDEVGSLGFQYAGALLYMFGAFSSILDLDRINDIEYWRLIIAYCSIKLPASTPDETYLRQMTEHFFSVEGYGDAITIERYNRFNIAIKDFYDMLNYMIVNYSNIIRTYNPADLLHKELASKEFLIENLIHAANEFKFRIRNKSNITPKIINREIDFHFKLFGIDRSIRENNTILEQTGTDNPFIDYGLGIIRQTKSTISRGPGGKKEEFDPNHPGSLIDASQPYVVSYQYASGPSPEGSGMLMPRVSLLNGKYTSIRDSDRKNYNSLKARLKGVK